MHREEESWRQLASGCRRCKMLHAVEQHACLDFYAFQWQEAVPSDAAREHWDAVHASLVPIGAQVCIEDVFSWLDGCCLQAEAHGKQCIRWFVEGIPALDAVDVVPVAQNKNRVGHMVFAEGISTLNAAYVVPVAQNKNRVSQICSFQSHMGC